MGDYWKENGIKKPQQKIVCAACRKGEAIALGARHFDKRMREQMKWTPIVWGDAEQGFIDQFGDFITREDAMDIAIAAGQAISLDRNVSITQLYSEGLY